MNWYEAAELDEINSEFTTKALYLYPEFRTLYGPYSCRRDLRKHVIFYNNRKRKTVSWPKLKIEVKLGRLLTKHEDVDHINEDRTNNKYENLQILPRGENSRKSVLYKHGPTPIVTCSNCNKQFTRCRSWKQGKYGYFCCGSCRGKYIGRLISAGEINNRPKEGNMSGKPGGRPRNELFTCYAGEVKTIYKEIKSYHKTAEYFQNKDVPLTLSQVRRIVNTY